MNHKKILVIDDEFPIRYLVEYQLSRKGFEVSSAKDGPSGIKAAHLQRPDLIVLDIMMPEMNGFEVCQTIRQDPDIGNIPIIFLTALMTKEYKTRAFDVGGNDYITKPFQVDDLVTHIMAVLRQSDREQTGELEPVAPGRVVALFSPKGGVGTTTLAVHLAESLVLREDRQVVLIDLDLPLGGIAPMLSLYTRYHVVELLKYAPNSPTLPFINRFMQQHRTDLMVIPAPGKLLGTVDKALAAKLQPILETLKTAGYQVILDLGSSLTDLTLAALRQADLTFVVTSGQPVANKLNDAFFSSAETLGLEPQRLMPVINEVHGRNDDVRLAKAPVARIPHNSEKTQTRLWLREQGLRKLMSVML